jgi:YidC/Oxa1 family membrane protein insertase
MLDFIIIPFLNALVFIYGVLGENFGLAIIIFTIAVRLATYPFTAQQMKSAQGMQEMQKSKKWQDIQKKYKGDKEKLAQEQMKLYQELGINPLGSCLPTLLQLPIIFALYWAVTRTLASTPLQLLQLTRDISLGNAAQLIPLNSHFLWMDLSQPERWFPSFLPDVGIPVLAIIVVITSYLQTKLMTPTAQPGDQGAGMSQAMGIYMPLLMGYFSYAYSAGLALYFVTSNVASIIQYALMGRLNLENLLPKKKSEKGTKDNRK